MTEQRDLFQGGVAEAPSPALTEWPPARDGVRRRAAAIDALSEAETLELLLGRCAPQAADPTVLADRLIARFGGVCRVLGAPLADLELVVGAETAGEITLLHALLLRTLQYPLKRRAVLSSWEAAKAYLRTGLGALPREVFHVLFLDKKNQLIADERMGVGSISHAPVYPREVMRRALELSSSALLFAHNHPTGDPSPSPADIEMTRQLVAAGKPLDIAVHDHFIVGGDQVVSFKALGLI